MLLSRTLLRAAARKTTATTMTLAARRCLRSSGSSSISSKIGVYAWASTTTSSIRVMSTSTAATAAAGAKPPPPAMFCRQCEQTQNHTACVTVGVCGKTSETAAVQDALIPAVQSLSAWTVAARKASVDQDLLQAANELILQGAFSTLTNVNFSEARICAYIQKLEDIKAQLKNKLKGTEHEPTDDVPIAHTVNLHGLDFAALEEYGYTVSVPNRQVKMQNDDAFALNELATYALKGVCAYASHCQQLGYMDDDIMNDIQKVWITLSRADNADVTGLLATVLHVGEINARVMAQLDQAHCEQMGEPTPTQYRSSAVKGKAILVSYINIVWVSTTATPPHHTT
jgi:hydroxylamine reductase